MQIDENRYTRYERAEVEPDLDMIRRICATLSVTPNDLLGHAEPDGPARSSRQRGRSGAQPPQVDGAATSGPFGIATAAWRLAEAATDLRRAVAKSANGASPDGPLAAVSHTGTLYKALMHQPFEAITELLGDPDIGRATTSQSAALRERIDRLVELLR